MATNAERLLQELFAAYVEMPAQVVQQQAQKNAGGLHRAICDYIAGMTDRYVIQERAKLYDF